MKLKKFVYIFSITIFISSLSDCVARNPKNLKYSSLKVVSRGEGNRFVEGIIKPSLEKKFIYLQLNMITKEDILSLAIDGNYLISIESYFCNKPNSKVLIDSGSLFWKGEDINVKANELIESLGKRRKKSLPEASNELFTYTVFLGINSPVYKSWKKNSDGSYKVEYEAYDLVKRPEDICVTIIGRTMVDGFKSNIVKIDKSIIQNALKSMKSLK